MTTIDPRLVQAIIEMVDTRFAQLAAQQPVTRYGIVDSVNTTAKTVDVFLGGDSNPSPGFYYPAWYEPAAGDKVRVAIDPRGDRYVEEVYGTPVYITASRVRVVATDDASATSTLHGFQVGSSSGQNVIIDNNEIMARNNGVVDTLFLQNDGGLVQVGTGGLDSNGPIVGTDITASGGLTGASGGVTSSWSANTGDPNGETIVLSGNNYIELKTRSAGIPSAADAGNLRLFADTSAGKVRLRVRFPGGTQTIITEA